MAPLPVLIDDVVAEQSRQDTEAFDGTIAAKHLDPTIHGVVREHRRPELVQVDGDPEERHLVCVKRPAVGLLLEPGEPERPGETRHGVCAHPGEGLRHEREIDGRSNARRCCA